MNAPMLLLGGLLLGTGAVLSRRQSTSDLGWLGDDPSPPSSFDPSRSNRAAYLRTHAAKKFWGATVLAAQGAASMDKFAARIRSSDPDAAGKARSVSEMLRDASRTSAGLALEYDAPWVRNRMARSGLAFEPETP